jgi:hypothetical protein
MSLTALTGNQPTPTLSFNFENTATDTMTGLAPSTMYEILVFTKSLYDLDGTSSITQIYNNQLSYTGT